MYDVVIIGGGPSGLAAGIYLARANYRVVIVEKNHFGGQITITSEVVNYPGVKKVSGQQLADNMLEQAKNFGAEFMLAEVTGFDLTGDIKKVKTTKGELECFGILLAVGASPRMVGFKGEAEFKGKGIAYCATCDGEFFKGKDGDVVGGGVALVKCANALQQHINTINGDEKIGAQIVYNALFAPIKQIAENAGVNGGVIIDKILSNNDVNFGYDALNDCYVNMFEAGIIDPTKVTRTALINAASVAGTMLTTTGIVCEEDLNTNAK